MPKNRLHPLKLTTSRLYRCISSICIISLGIILVPASAKFPGEPGNKDPQLYKVYITKAITNNKILPKTFPLPDSPLKELHIAACPGEYEAATFVIRAGKNLKGLKVTGTDLKNDKNSIPASAIDLHAVKCWFQSGVQVYQVGGCILTPELLLKDDGLVRVDLKNRQNYLRQGNDYILISGKDPKALKDIRPQDAPTLQPVDLAAETNKQFWITLHVPDHASPGLYEGKIELKADNAPSSSIPLKLAVLPFKLEKPLLRYALYYLSRVSLDDHGTITAEGPKSVQQYRAELHDLKIHGVDYPSIGAKDVNQFQQELGLREKEGFPKEALYITSPGTGYPTNPQQLELLKQRTKSLIDIAKEFHYGEVFFYGVDEAQGDKLRAQRPAWDSVHQAGGRIFAACKRKGVFELVGDILDLAVMSGPPDGNAAQQFHQAGHKVFCYGNPMVGVEQPETYRRNYGLLLWKAGYDGEMDFAYQWTNKGHIWNDFDDKVHRPHCFAYPTVNGIIDTVQWEGFREGVDDIRYLSTLLHHIQKAPPEKREIAQKARKWVNDLNLANDLDSLRAQMVEWILQLQ